MLLPEYRNTCIKKIFFTTASQTKTILPFSSLPSSTIGNSHIKTDTSVHTPVLGYSLSIPMLLQRHTKNSRVASPVNVSFHLKKLHIADKYKTYITPYIWMLYQLMQVLFKSNFTLHTSPITEMFNELCLKLTDMTWSMTHIDHMILKRASNNLNKHCLHRFKPTIKILSIVTDRSKQTMNTKIKLLLQEQSDHC